MKAITMDIKRRSSTKRTIVTSVIGTAAASAASYAVREITRRRGSKHGRASAMMPGKIERIVTGSGQWATPVNQRPRLFFDKGNVSRMLDSTTQLHADSPASPVALMDFVALQQSSYQTAARSQLTRLLATSYPNAASIRSNRAALSEALDGSEDQLNSQLSRCELTYLRYIHRVRPTSSAKLTRLTGDLRSVAKELGKLPNPSQRRQASARIILADVYLWQGLIDESNEQMSRALVLMGSMYNDRELIKLSTEANGHQIIDETYKGSTDLSVQQRAHELADAETQ